MNPDPKSLKATARLNRALEIVARHQATRERHRELFVRLRAAQDRQDELREVLKGQREHNLLAIAEMQSLRSALCSYVAQLRTSEVPPERVLTLIKAALRDVIAGMEPNDRPRDSDQIKEQLVEWAIGEYYAA